MVVAVRSLSAIAWSRSVAPAGSRVTNGSRCGRCRDRPAGACGRPPRPRPGPRAGSRPGRRAPRGCAGTRRPAPWRRRGRCAQRAVSARRTGAAASPGRRATPSRWSSVWNSSPSDDDTHAPSSSQSGSRARRRPALSRCTASGGLAAIAPGQLHRRRAAARSWGTTRPTRPMRRASAASMTSPVNSSSAARSRPTSCGQPAEAGDVASTSPRSTNSSPNLARSLADADVGHQRQLHPPADRGAVDRGDDRHVGVQQRVGRRREAGLALGRRRRAAAGRRPPITWRRRRRSRTPGSAPVIDQAARRGRARPPRSSSAYIVPGQRVAGLGPVERDDADVPVDGVGQIGGRGSRTAGGHRRAP